MVGVLIVTIVLALVFLRASSNGIKLRDITISNLLATARKAQTVSNPYEKCICPPKKIIFVGGLYSQKDDAMEKKIKELSHVPNGNYSAIPLSDERHWPGDIEKAKKELEKQIREKGKDKQSILVIGFSAGSTVKTVVEEMKKQGYCVDFLALDPPIDKGSKCLSVVWPIPPIPFADFDNIGNQWRKINQAMCAAKLTNDDGLVWTNGTASDLEDGTPHNPAEDPNRNNADKILKKIEDRIAEAKKCSAN